MALTTAPDRSDRNDRNGRPEHRTELALIVVLTAVLVLAMIGVAVLVRGGGSSTNGIQGSGAAVTQTRTVASFTGLDLAGSNNVTVIVGAPQSVVVHADSNLINHVTTGVVAGTLVIGNTGSFTPRAPMSVDVSVPSLTALTISGSGQISATGINAARLTVTVSGSGMLSAAGTATRLDVTIGGSGRLQLSQLTARDVYAVIAGYGLIQVTATASLDAAILGDGTIVYGGNPSQVTTSVTGTGAITRG
jgi:Putative auto-transporter adhesin, head GIN domain